LGLVAGILKDEAVYGVERLAAEAERASVVGWWLARWNGLDQLSAAVGTERVAWLDQVHPTAHERCSICQIASG
jgi:hypothetical protein